MNLKQKQTINFYIVAMILDFSSPSSQKLIQQQSGGKNDQVAIYPMRAKTGEKELSSCKMPLQKFINAHSLGEWTGKTSTEAKGELPVAGALKKIEFDLQFELHGIEKLVINTAIPAEKDACGQNVCEIISKIEKTLLSKGDTLRVFATSPIPCKLLPLSPLLFEDENGRLNEKSAQALAVFKSQGKIAKAAGGKRGKKAQQALTAKIKQDAEVAAQKAKEAALTRGATMAQAEAAGKEAAKAVVAAAKAADATSTAAAAIAATSPAAIAATAAIDPVKDNSTTLDLQGPPFRVVISQDGRPPITVRVPGSIPMKEGRWTMKIISPSWLSELPEISNSVSQGAHAKLNIKEALDSQLQWVESSPDEDQTVLFDPSTNRPNILIPKGGPPIPMPRQGMTFKVVRGNSDNPEGT